ncbi:3-hydroxyisobutyrate dehydrogenase [Goodfellowiella coeruleoviolacea]|uniref:3-hydroxyisobutyrate dehydrogenase n=1 Tax=Goodfellowiella coeruleoviolacea TaxID=334858 RepID=A0AAE3GKD6_9PSEU|nr:3-hydroxyisobutyrate dehydrogenase [Goodfellowiella coeruleoviolacea]
MTVLGLGPMGQALAGAFLASGHPTTVWNRSADKADALVAKGATRAATVADAVAASPLVIVCVIDYTAVRAIVDAAGDTLTGRTLVNLTADSPDRARELAAWAAERGVDYLDGTILTPAFTIGGPNAVLLYSGPEATYQAHRATLASLGGTATHLGADPGRAAAHDVALIDMYWTAVSGIVHGFALAGAEGIAAADLVPFAQGIAGLLTTTVATFAEQLSAGEYPGHTSNIQSAAAGMAHVIHAAEARGIDTTVLSAARAIAQQAIDAGQGKDSFSRLAQRLQPPTTA